MNTPCAAYAEALPKWQRVRDCRSGRDAIIKAGTKYLPALPGGKPEAYEAYQKRASFYNAVKRTIAGLVGLIFQKAPAVQDATRIKAVLDDVTPRGHVSFEQFAARVTEEVMTPGRVGILVDIPADGSRPYAAMYRAEDVISWRTGRNGADEVLTRVVLAETVEAEDPKDRFVTKCVPRYRVLELVEDVYTQTVWAPKNDKLDQWQVVETITPVRRKVPLDFIPFLFIGPTGVGPDVEDPPLLDLADVNLGHYRNSADHEHGLHLVALPTPWVSGLRGGGGPPQVGQTAGPIPAGPALQIGPSVVWELELNGSAGMLKYEGTGLEALLAAMAEKKAQMASLGARLLEEQPSGAQDTATGIRMRHSGDHATLRTIAQGIEQGLTMVVQWLGWWSGIEAKPADFKARVELNKEFFAVRMSPDEVRVLLQALMADEISDETFYEALQKGGWAREGVTIEKEREAIANRLKQRMDRMPDLTGDDPLEPKPGDPPAPPFKKAA